MNDITTDTTEQVREEIYAARLHANSIVGRELDWRETERRKGVSRVRITLRSDYLSREEEQLLTAALKQRDPAAEKIGWWNGWVQTPEGVMWRHGVKIVADAIKQPTRKVETLAFVENDGGRYDTGRHTEKHAGDCVARAIAIASGKDYDLVWNALARRKTSRRRYACGVISSDEITADHGVSRKVYKPYLSRIGFDAVFKVAPRQRRITISQAYKRFGDGVAQVQRTGKARKQGGHMVAVQGGAIHDIFDCGEQDYRVIEYWVKKK